jgi:hypothetical protein
MVLTGENVNTQGNHASIPPCPLEVSLELTWNRTQASAVRIPRTNSSFKIMSRYLTYLVAYRREI